MKPSHAIQLAIILLGVATASCTHTKTTKLKLGDTSTEGFRYSLPQPFLLVTPKPDGTMTVETVYLPDESKQYAVESSSFLAKHKLQINIADGLLEKIITNSDTATIASKAAGAAGTLGEKAIQAKAEAHKARAEELKAASAAEEQAQLNLDLATATREAAQSADPPNPAALAAAQLAEEQAQIRLDFATRARSSAFNAPETDTGITRPAQVLYRIIDTGDSVRLQAVNYKIPGSKGTSSHVQPRLGTSKKIEKKKATPPTAALDVGIEGERVIRPDSKTGAIRFTVVSNKANTKFGGGVITINPVPVDPLPTVTLSNQLGKKSVIVTLEKTAPKGDYTIKLNVKVGDAAAVPKTLTFKIER